MTATLVGRFVAPLGDDKFTKTGRVELDGTLKYDQNESYFEANLNVIEGYEGFADIKGGNLFLPWFTSGDDTLIYYVGTFCF